MEARRKENWIIGLIMVVVIVSGVSFVVAAFQDDGVEERMAEEPATYTEPDLFARPIQPEAVKVFPNPEEEREKRLAPKLEWRNIDVIKVKNDVSLEYYVRLYFRMGGDVELTLKCNGWRVYPQLPDGYEVKICGKPRSNL